MSAVAPAAPSEIPFLEQVRTFGRPFWAANVMELLERLAYYGVRVVVPIYIASSEDPFGLHFTNVQKGTIFTIWALIQTLLPMFTGGYADRYGTKSTILVSITVKVVGYVLMATQRSFEGFLLGCCVLATGTALFKPGVWATLVRGTSRTNSSVGWGIFYEVVNVGGFLGPPLAGYLRHLAWKWVFLACAVIVALNFLVVFTYEEDKSALPYSHAGHAAPRALTKGTPWEVFVYSVRRFFRVRLVLFILINGGFYVMFMQLYDMLPNFIEEWVNSSDIVQALGLSEGQLARSAADPLLSRGLQVPQEWMINLNAGTIVLLVIFVSHLNRKLRRLVAIALGILVSAAGLALCGATTGGFICLLGIFVFAFGEMTAVPKLNEYLGVIAPKGEEGLYMGYANIPFAIGWMFADLLGGSRTTASRTRPTSRCVTCANVT
jgi:dipeptide/tripeptide permease